MTLLRRTIGALAGLAAAGEGRTLVVGEGNNRITAELVDLDIEPSEVMHVLDPTAVDAKLAESLRLPGSLSDLAAPWREGARAAFRATGAVTQAMLAAGGGRYELAAGLQVSVRNVLGPTWSAGLMRLTGGPIVFSAGIEPTVRCTGVEITARLTSEDLERRTSDLPIQSVHIEDERIEIRPQGRWHAVSFRVWPRLDRGRIALETRELGWRDRSIRLPASLVRRLIRWIDPPAWMDVQQLTVASGAVSVVGTLEEWAQPMSLETMQRLAQAAQRRGQDLVLPGRQPATEE